MFLVIIALIQEFHVKNQQKGVSSKFLNTMENYYAWMYWNLLLLEAGTKLKNTIVNYRWSLVEHDKICNCNHLWHTKMYLWTIELKLKIVHRILLSPLMVNVVIMRLFTFTGRIFTQPFYYGLLFNGCFVLCNRFSSLFVLHYEWNSLKMFMLLI